MLSAYTHDTRSINRLRFLAPVFAAGFSYHMRSEWKFLAPHQSDFIFCSALCNTLERQ